VIGLVTNALVRYVVQQDPEQAAVAARLLEGQDTPEDPGFVSALVLAELVWVLGGAYGYGKGTILAVLRQVLATAELTVEDSALAWRASTEFEQEPADFADYLTGHGNRARGCSRTYTFGRKAGHSPLFELLA
jgi:predicted nucleic-acid-binding protein